MCSCINKGEQKGAHIVYKVPQTYLIIGPFPHTIFFKTQSNKAVITVCGFTFIQLFN